MTSRIWRGTSARWAAAAFLETEKHFNRVMGYRDLWALKAIAWNDYSPPSAPINYEQDTIQHFLKLRFVSLND